MLADGKKSPKILKSGCFRPSDGTSEVVRAPANQELCHWSRKSALPNVAKKVTQHTPPPPTKMDPQRIIQLQKHYQNTNKELWLKGPRAKLLVYPFYAMFAFSTAASFYYTGRAIAGIKDE
ncbi:hypothetical protein JCM33374_g4582 [Metschnikowia sp. JCM 33374]|nr:hypothetical protein JCM33374_g4582 [Metschnikowia sp. JCM 33374]